MFTIKLNGVRIGGIGIQRALNFLDLNVGLFYPIRNAIPQISGTRKMFRRRLRLYVKNILELSQCLDCIAFDPKVIVCFKELCI